MAIAGRKSNRYLNIILALVESGMFSSVVMGVFLALIYAQMVSFWVSRSISHLVKDFSFLLGISHKTDCSVFDKGIGYRASHDHVGKADNPLVFLFIELIQFM